MKAAKLLKSVKSSYNLRSSSTSSSNMGDEVNSSDFLTTKDRDMIIQAINDSNKQINQRLDVITGDLNDTKHRVKALEEIHVEERLKALELAKDELEMAKKGLNEAKQDSENQSIMHDLKMKERNIVVWGVPQQDVWENRSESFRLCYEYLFPVVLNIPTSTNIYIEDAHRLRSRASTAANSSHSEYPTVICAEMGTRDAPKFLQKPQGLIFRVSTMKQHELIMKAFWDNISVYNHNNEENIRIHVSERHLPMRMQNDHKKLLPNYLKAKKAGNKPRWFVNKEKAIYCFKSNGIVHEPTGL